MRWQGTTDMPGARQRLGDAGERYAERLLTERGWRILERKWRGTLGEIDLVAETREGGLVFVEVKTRRGERLGAAEEAISAEKAERLLTLGEEFVASDSSLWNRPWRVDLVAITLGPRGDVARVSHIVDACEAE
jgi:putative endonuclease